MSEQETNAGPEAHPRSPINNPQWRSDRLGTIATLLDGEGGNTEIIRRIMRGPVVVHAIINSLHSRPEDTAIITIVFTPSAITYEETEGVIKLRCPAGTVVATKWGEQLDLFFVELHRDRNWILRTNRTDPFPAEVSLV